MITRGDVCWVNLPTPTGSEAGFRRPALVVQGDSLNATAIATVVVVPLTSNLRWAAAPGNVLLTIDDSGPPTDSVANVSQIRALDRSRFEERAGSVPAGILEQVLAGIDLVLRRE